MAKKNAKATVKNAQADKQQNGLKLCDYWHNEFKRSMVAKQDYTKRWTTYMDAYNGEYFKNNNLDSHRSNQVSNYIYATVETVRPLMLENNPKFEVFATTNEAVGYAQDVSEILSYEWDRIGITPMLSSELINVLVYGTGIFYVSWNRDEKEIEPIPVSVFNLFPDPLATSVKDAEYLIYASYQHENKLKKAFPSVADELIGGSIKYSELVNQNDEHGAQIDNQILVLEIYYNDWTSSYKDNDKKKRSNKSEMRVLTICPELGVVLSDKANPYKDNTFPFVIIKDVDIPGKFWGEGDVSQLLSPQQYINELNNLTIDNAKMNANAPWLLDKNCGIGVGKIVNMPGLILRKNPNTEVTRMEHVPIPNYIPNTVFTLKDDMEQISGVFDTLRGNSETGVYTAQGIIELKEAAQVRIRLKVKTLEHGLGAFATMIINRVKQFWKEDKIIKVTHFDGTYDIKEFDPGINKHNYNIRITANSTMSISRSAMLDLMIRLSQTMAEDGLPMVDRQATLEFLPSEMKTAILKRSSEDNIAMVQLQEELQEMTGRYEESMGLIEQSVQQVEQLKNVVVEMKQEHDKIKAEREEEEKADQQYNAGFYDAEKIYGSFDDYGDSIYEGASEFDQDLGSIGEDMPIPEDVLEELENLSDEELAALLQQYPELKEYIEGLNTTKQAI